MRRISYQSETPRDYAAALASADTLEALRAAVADFGELAQDAAEIVTGMDEASFQAWRKGLAKERRGVFAGKQFVETFGAVLMPAMMIRVSLVARRFGTPFGVAYLRMKEYGTLQATKEPDTKGVDRF